MTAEDPSVDKKQPMSRRSPLNTTPKSIYAASRYMALKNFDPLEKLIKLYEKIQGEIQWMERLKEATVVCKDGTTHKYSKMSHHKLIEQQQKLLNDLMRYGYSRMPETLNVEAADTPIPVINLTPRIPSASPSMSPKVNIVEGEFKETK